MPTRSSLNVARAHVQSIAPDPINRARHDFYRTPPIGTERLLAHEKFKGPIWEPACGDGAISEVLRANGHKVTSTDITDYGYPCAARRSIDFLTHRPRFAFDNIVTNPPFTHCLEFAEHALSLKPQKVALLMRLLWLEGKKRKAFFQASGLSRVLVHSGRLNVSRYGHDYGDGGEGGMVAFAWMIWERGHKGPPTLHWI